MIEQTTRMVARPVWARRERRLAGEMLAAPTEIEKQDAIRVLEAGIRWPVSLYAEAERIMAEETGEAIVVDEIDIESLIQPPETL